MNAKILLKINGLIQGIEMFEKYNPSMHSKMEAKILSIENGIKEINEIVKHYKFHSLEEEIEFFKKIKPQIDHTYIYLKLLLEFYCSYNWIAYRNTKIYKQKLEKVLEFLHPHKEFHTYLKSGASHYDEFYFRRMAETNKPRTIYNFNADPLVCCSHGFLMAMIMAYERFEQFCNYHIQQIKNGNIKYKSTANFQWKAKKVDAIELVYALYYSGAIDTSLCTIYDLAYTFEHLFKIEITEHIYRDFIDIKRRKIEPAKFLVKMLNGFKTHVEQSYS